MAAQTNRPELKNTLFKERITVHPLVVWKALPVSYKEDTPDVFMDQN